MGFAFQVLIENVELPDFLIVALALPLQMCVCVQGIAATDC